MLGTMPRGGKAKYTDKQIRKADHIAESYGSRDVPEKEAERRAWATVNKESGGGKKSGSGRGQLESHVSSRKGGALGGQASANRSAAERSDSASCGHSQVACLALNAKTSCSHSFAKPFRGHGTLLV
jgi:plasmid stabilization system protein ParE